MSAVGDENSFPDNMTVIGKVSPFADRLKNLQLSPLVEEATVGIRGKPRNQQEGLEYSEDSDEASSVDDVFNQSLTVKSTMDAEPEWSSTAPVQFIRSRGDEFEITDEGRAHLLSVGPDRKVIVITVCGLYRTGKSYLLNLLSGRIGPKSERLNPLVPVFQTSGTVNACTSGIWIWASSSRFSSEEPVYILVDCEGSGNTANSKDHDARLFAVAMLMSSYFMYNSRGVIDETSLSSLATVAAVARSAISPGQISQRSKPRCMWVLRDFVLALEDEFGTQISSSEYLENSLRGRRSYRKLLLDLFGSLDCTTLTAPAVEETKLQKLIEVGWSSLRPEFRDQISNLRGKIFRDSLPKRSWSSSNDMSVRQLVIFIQKILANLNQKKEIPTVSSAWKQVRSNEIDHLVNELVADYERRIDTLALPLNEDELENTLNRIKKEVVRKLKKSQIENVEEAEKLKQDVLSLFQIANQRIQESNEKATKEAAEQVLRQLWKDEVVAPLKTATTVPESLVEERISVLRAKYFSQVVGVQSVCRRVFDDNILPRREKLLADIKNLPAQPPVDPYARGLRIPQARKRPSLSCQCVLM